jgi:hypothetical protein
VNGNVQIMTGRIRKDSQGVVFVHVYCKVFQNSVAGSTAILTLPNTAWPSHTIRQKVWWWNQSGSTWSETTGLIETNGQFTIPNLLATNDGVELTLAFPTR